MVHGHMDTWRKLYFILFKIGETICRCLSVIQEIIRSKNLKLKLSRIGLTNSQSIVRFGVKNG